ncbi:c-type cytochrome, partial [Effusibacillus lacus]
TAPDKNEPPKTAAGPVDKGKELYDKHGCAGCHSINGNGGSFGPDLTKVGSNRTKEWIAEFLKKPSPKMAITPLNPEEIQVLSEYLSTFK